MFVGVGIAHVDEPPPNSFEFSSARCRNCKHSRLGWWQKVITSMRPKTYRDLDVWQAGMDLAIGVYQTTRSLPVEERFGLASQMRRAALSIPSNVAEGHAFRFQQRAYLRHVRIALGSFAELETHLEVVARLRLIDNTALESSMRQ